MDTQMEPKRPMALATATLVLQISRDESWDEMTPTEARFGLEAAIGRDKTLRPLQPVVMHEADTFVELQCEVEYGPERGSEGHLLRHLRRQLTSIGEKMGRARCEVFHFSYRTVTADQITAMSADLKARCDDVTLPLAERSRMQDIAQRYARFVKRAA